MTFFVVTFRNLFLKHSKSFRLMLALNFIVSVVLCVIAFKVGDVVGILSGAASAFMLLVLTPAMLKARVQAHTISQDNGRVSDYPV